MRCQLLVMANQHSTGHDVATASNNAGSAVVRTDYVLLQLGEGIEKVESDFAVEVAAAAGLA